MGGKRRKLQMKQQAANGGKAGTAVPGRSSAARAFIPNRHSDKPLAAAGPSSGGGSGRQHQAKKQSGSSNKKSQEQRQRQLQRNLDNPTIPFDADDRILLVGEGDLSFAASLVRHHGCRHVTATVLDRDHAELVAKHPSADANIAVFHGVKLPEEATTKKKKKSSVEGEGAAAADEQDNKAATDDDDDDDDDDDAAAAPPPEQDSDSDADYDADGNHRPRAPKTNRLLYAVDATKLPSSLGRPPFDRILFNFPHVGGKSTDVNRQVRYNQELLVGFFRRALPLLAPGGTLVVTVFDGEPYTLWNVRDLARHVGLQADASFRFVAAAYPGYRHARTLGALRRRSGGEVVEGAWRGEERPARSFVFVRKGDVLRKPRGQQAAEGGGHKNKKKRKRGSDDETESSEDDLDD